METFTTPLHLQEHVGHLTSNIWHYALPDQGHMEYLWLPELELSHHYFQPPESKIRSTFWIRYIVDADNFQAISWIQIPRVQDKTCRILKTVYRNMKLRYPTDSKLKGSITDKMMSEIWQTVHQAITTVNMIHDFSSTPTTKNLSSLSPNTKK